MSLPALPSRASAPPASGAAQGPTPVTKAGLSLTEIAPGARRDEIAAAYHQQPHRGVEVAGNSALGPKICRSRPACLDAGPGAEGIFRRQVADEGFTPPGPRPDLVELGFGGLDQRIEGLQQGLTSKGLTTTRCASFMPASICSSTKRRVAASSTASPMVCCMSCRAPGPGSPWLRNWLSRPRRGRAASDRCRAAPGRCRCMVRREMPAKASPTGPHLHRRGRRGEVHPPPRLGARPQDRALEPLDEALPAALQPGIELAGAVPGGLFVDAAKQRHNRERCGSPRVLIRSTASSKFSKG